MFTVLSFISNTSKTYTKNIASIGIITTDVLVNIKMCGSYYSYLIICAYNFRHHLVFGKVVKGFEILCEMQTVQTNAAGRPVVAIVISDSGLLIKSPLK